MELKTTFWSDQVHSFDQLLYMNNNGNEVLFRTDLSDPFASYLFFKNVSKFVKTKKSLESIYEENKDCFQFAVIFDGNISPIKWFDLIIGSNVVSHDIAFLDHID